MSRLNYGTLGVIALILVAICLGAGAYKALNYLLGDVGEDSWQDFLSGGVFSTQSPSGASANGTICFSSPCTGHGDIYYQLQSGESPRRLTTSDCFETSPLLAHSQDKIFFSRETNGFKHLWMINLDGSNETQLTHGRVQDVATDVSLNDRYLIFHRHIGTPLNHGRRIYAKVLDVTRRLELADVGATATMSHATDTVAYTEDMSVITTLHINGRSVVRKNLSTHGWPLQFTADGKYLLMSRGKVGATPYDEREIWLWDCETARDSYVADGYSAAIFGVEEPKVLIMKTNGPNRNEIPHVFRMDGRALGELAIRNAITMQPRLTHDGRSLLMAELFNNGQQVSEIIALDHVDIKPRTIAIVNCAAK